MKLLVFLVFVSALPSAEANVNPTGDPNCNPAHDRGIDQNAEEMISYVRSCEKAKKNTDKNCLHPNHVTAVPQAGNGRIPGSLGANQNNLLRAYYDTYQVGMACKKSMKEIYGHCRNAPNNIERNVVKLNNPCDPSSTQRVQKIRQAGDFLRQQNADYQGKISVAADKINAQLNALSGVVFKNAETKSDATPQK